MNTSKYVTEKNNLIENTLEYLNSHELDDYAKQQIRELVSDYRPTINDREYAEEIFTNNSKEKAIEYLKQYNEHLPKELTRREKRSIEYDKKLLEEYQSNKNTNEFDDFLSIYEDEKVRNLWNIQSEDDLITFYNGTSKTRAEHFLTRGTGGTRLENLAFINNATATSEIGIQVMFDNSRAAYYGKQQSALTKDTPVIIQGKIKAKYLHAGANWGYEYGIPQEYWDKIEEASILHAETGETLQKLKNGKLEPYVPIQQQFKSLMDNHWINNVNVQSKDAINQGLERLGKETNTTYSLPEVFLKHDNPTIKQHFAEVGLSKNDAQAYLFRQNDVLFLNMHGTSDGKVAFRQNKLNPSQFLDILYDAGMLPEDISKIYTISCFGGLQKTGTTTKNGIPIISSHTSNKPIASIPLPGEISFALANGELSEDLMEDVIRNKNFKVEEVLTPQQINEVVDERLNKLVKKPKYKVSRGPKLKEKVISNNNINDMEFIHYGHDHFDKDLFTYVNNTDTIIGKPKGGLWSSPINAEYGWKDFIDEGESWREEYLTKSFRFRLNEKANVLSVNTLEELEKLPTLNNKRIGKVIDYEKLVENGYDALLVNMSNDYEKFHYDTRTMAYDVDTLLVFNPDMVEEIPEEETTVTIEDNNTGIKTETVSTEDTNIPDSSENQNNAEKIKKEESVANSEKPDKKNNKSNKTSTKTSYKEHTKPNNKPDTNTKPPVDIVSPAPDAKNTSKPNYKSQRGPKINSTNITKEQIGQVKKAVKDTGMKTKKLAKEAAEAINWGKVGKVGAVIGVTALVGGEIYNHAKKEKKNRKNEPDRLTGTTRKSEFWNQNYAAQMAKDISTYQYGKRMTGFVQG